MSAIAAGASAPGGHQDPSLRAALETAAAFAAAVACIMQRDHFLRSWRRADLLILAAIAILGLVDLASFALPAVLPAAAQDDAPGTWMIATVIAASCLAAGAHQREAIMRADGRHWDQMALAAACGAAVAVELAGRLLGPSLTGTRSPARAGDVVAFSHLAALPLILAAMLLAGLAAVRLADDPDRSAAIVISAAAVLLAVDTLQTGAFGQPGPGAVSAETVLRAAVFALLALATLRQSSALRGAEARAIAERERRRLARDLHDGPCQDLAFIASMGSQISGAGGDHEHSVAVAAEHALASCRNILADLSASHAVDLRSALRSVADDLAFKFGISVEVHADRTDVRDADREEIVRIAREAIVNAARHGAARQVMVLLTSTEDSLVLRIADDGRGFTASNRRREGYGMTNMRERAAAIGAHIDVRRRPEGGTELEVIFR